MWLCKEEVRERDSDKDGKISFKEFFHGLFDTVRNYEEESHNSSHPHHDLPEGPAKQLFGQLDKDGDGYLSDAELLPIITKIHPTERYYAKQQADYIISQPINKKAPKGIRRYTSESENQESKDSESQTDSSSDKSILQEVKELRSDLEPLCLTAEKTTAVYDVKSSIFSSSPVIVPFTNLLRKGWTP
ncbi:PREDICTED: uncharacterized protein LOC104824953 [Tarenaya hassleriana]|uniref:uncharacterized protein LOC104824953 n=1 Tax=Tarenaya hassleriana TaxID=28532 RepID=UPI00053C30C3|nr:PREDICTED: uncharacterized protein LOC104824953 [Tarenaya hassleriana]